MTEIDTDKLESLYKKLRDNEDLLGFRGKLINPKTVYEMAEAYKALRDEFFREALEALPELLRRARAYEKFCCEKCGEEYDTIDGGLCGTFYTHCSACEGEQ